MKNSDLIIIFIYLVYSVVCSSYLINVYKWRLYKTYLLSNYFDNLNEFENSEKNGNLESIPGISNLLDIYGDKYEEDAEILEKLRKEKVIANDRWQSCTFRDTQCGFWDGINIGIFHKSVCHI